MPQTPIISHTPDGKTHTEMPQYRKQTVAGKILDRIAPRVGAKINFEPWGFAGQIEFQSGKKAYFRGSSVGLNTIAAADIAQDKDFSNFFMNKMGYRTIPGEKFFSDAWAEQIGSDQTKDKALAYARSVGFPLVVKPNSGSQGRGVARVENEQQFIRAIDEVFQMDRICLVQKFISGQDYRLVVLDDKMITAYERIPLNVTGNGVSVISELLQQKQDLFVQTGRDVKIQYNDPRIIETLALQSLTLDSVPRFGQKVMLLSNANLSSGGDGVDVTDLVSRELKELCVRLTKDMGLRLCGVDLMLKDGITAPKSHEDYYVLEINASPGLGHYANIGAKQEQVVEDLYFEVLKKLDD